MSAASVAERTATMSGAPIGGMAATRQVSASHVPPQYGGQAVIEGVMMRGRQGMAVAVRQPSGRVVVHSELLEGVAYRSAWVRWPFVRGALLLGHSMTLGIRALVYSANVAVDGAGGSAAADGGPGPAESGSEPAPARTCAREPQELQEPWEAAAEQAFGGPLLWGTMVVSLAFAVGLFFVLPVLLSRLVEPLLAPGLLVALSEGAIRVGLLVAYLWLIGRAPRVRRLFAYHGAEHKAINAFESGEPLRPDRVACYSVAHPRCGTTFMLYVVVVSALVFSLLGQPALPVRIAERIVLVPLIAAVAYEALRFSGRQRFRPIMRVLLWPGLALQALTTREPDGEQVEVAIAALQRVIALDATDADGRALPSAEVLSLKRAKLQR